jgi:hypothetical protein
MSESTKIKRRIAGEEVDNCNCSWGCPCQFSALPTAGRESATLEGLRSGPVLVGMLDSLVFFCETSPDQLGRIGYALE